MKQDLMTSDSTLAYDSKIYIAGHRGLVGSAIYRRLKAEGFINLLTRTHTELNLERQDEVEAFFQAERPDYVFLAAAKVGGIWANYTYPAEFIYRNLTILTNIIHASWKSEVKRLLFLGSSCIYPRDCPQPMKEEYLLTGPLEITNQPYAIAKITGIIQCQSYNRQYGTHYLGVMPTNLYGPNDNFDLESSHVLPALIRKFHLAKLAKKKDWKTIIHDERRFGPIPQELRNLLGIPDSLEQLPHKFSTLTSSPLHVTLWGTGSPYREFLHVDDLADACLFLMKLPNDQFPSFFKPSYSLPILNVGCGEDRTIKDLATLVARVVGYEGEIFWDKTKPDGTPRKLLDISRLKALGWSPTIDLGTGIKSTYEWYLRQLTLQD